MVDQNNLNLSVSILDKDTGELRRVYECIPQLGQAHYLAIHAMNNDRYHFKELVVIMPGSNMQLSGEERGLCIQLADTYRVRE